MKLKPTQLDSLISDIESTESIEKSEQRFKKSFSQQYMKLYYISVMGRVFFPLLSIILGASFVASILVNIINSLYFCLVFGALLLIIWELAKAETLINTFEIYYGGKNSWVFPACILMVLQIGSILAGVLGANEIYLMRDNRKELIIEKYRIESDSISKFYESRIDYVNNEIDGLKKKAVNQWNGINTPEQYNLINSLRAQETQLSEDRSNKLSDVKKSKDYDLLKAGEKAGFNIKYFMIISLLIELLIFFCGVFVIYYHARRVKDFQIIREYKITKVTPENTNLSLTENTPHETNTQVNTQRRAAGFVIGKTPNTQTENTHTTHCVGAKKHCEQCGTEFTIVKAGQRFCGKSCRWQHHNFKLK